MIDLIDVHKSFGSVSILRGLNLTIEKGETFVILGRSGIGKSVTLRHIVGLLHPDQGTVRVFDQNVSELTTEQLRAHRGRIGYLFQDGALLNWFTVGENVALPLREHTRLPDAEIRERCMKALGMVELQDAWDKYPNEISGGMRKRAGLARALVEEPEILLYDEPTSGLDPISSSIINRLVNSLKAELGVTQIVVTHDMGSAFAIADRIALLHNGVVRAHGTSQEIQDSEDPAIVQFIHGLVEGPLSRD